MNELRHNRGASGGIKGFFKRREAFTLVLLIGVLIVSMSISSSFRDLTYVLKSATRYMELGMVALTMTLIIIAGMIDLSAPTIMVCSATICAMMFHAGVDMTLAIITGIAVGFGLGAVNGILVAYAKLPAMIVTIGTMNVYRGIAQIFIGDKSLGSFPDWFNSIEKVPVFDIGNARFALTILMFAIFAVIFAIVLHKTVLGRRIYAVGTNEQAAIHSGVKTKRLKFGLFCASGLMCGVAGILTMSRLLLVRYDMHQGAELDIVTMVLLGGADINGGRGSILGTVLAVLIVIILKTGLIVANVTSDTQMFVMGLILLVSIIVPNVNEVIKARKDK